MLEKKFATNLSKIFDQARVESILEKCLDQKALEDLSVLEFQEMLSVDNNSF